MSYHANDGIKVITIDEVSGSRIKDTLDRQATVNSKWRVFHELEKMTDCAVGSDEDQGLTLETKTPRIYDNGNMVPATRFELVTP